MYWRVIIGRGGRRYDIGDGNRNLAQKVHHTLAVEFRSVVASVIVVISGECQLARGMARKGGATVPRRRLAGEVMGLLSRGAARFGDRNHPSEEAEQKKRYDGRPQYRPLDYTMEAKPRRAFFILDIVMRWTRIQS